MSTPVVQAVRLAALGLALAAFIGAASGQVKSTAKAMTLTAMDYVEIRQLVNRYAFALDTGSSNGYDYADLFAGDGEFMRPYAKGREQLAALARGPRLGPDNTVHYIMNHVIEPTPDGAIGKATSLFLGGHYEDTYVKTTEGWRIKTRRLFPPRSGQQPQAAAAATLPAASAAQIAGTAVVAARASSLSAGDYIEIQQLIARSAYALDTAADRGAAYAQLFTANGGFITKTARPAEIKGRRQLGAFAAGDLAHRGPAFVREFLTNYIIQPSRSGATGRVYLVWIEVGENGNPGVIQSGGHYEDEYVKTRDGWRIGRRTFVPSRLVPRDIYDVARTRAASAPRAASPRELTPRLRDRLS